MRNTISSWIIPWTSKQISSLPNFRAYSRTTDETNNIKQLVSFYSEQWSKKRSVTSLDWSPKVIITTG